MAQEPGARPGSVVHVTLPYAGSHLTARVAKMCCLAVCPEGKGNLF